MRTKKAVRRVGCGCDESAAYLTVLRMVARWIETGVSMATGDGGGPCLCQEIDPKDIPCMVCVCRSGLVLRDIERVTGRFGRRLAALPAAPLKEVPPCKDPEDRKEVT